MNEEVELVRRMLAKQAGSLEKFEELYGPVVQEISQWRKWHVDTHKREDLRQFMWMKLLGKIHQFNGQCPLIAFVRRTCLLRGKDFMRSYYSDQKKWGEVVGDEKDPMSWLENQPSSELNPSEEALRIEMGRFLWQGVEQLSQECAQVIKGYFLHDKSYAELAVTLDWPQGTVASRLSRCLARLRDQCANSDGFGNFFRQRGE